MNHTVHTATILDHHRAANLVRENELLRRQAERAETLRAEAVGASGISRLRWEARRTRSVRRTRIAATH
jgi:hypothetical protein